MLLHIHPDNPQERNIKTAAKVLKDGGIIIYPTDTIYGLGCDIFNTSGIERICKIKQIDIKKAQFSFVCNDLSQLSHYAKSIDNPIFRILKRALPGPYTFILEASKQVPKMLKTKKETVGIRVPDHNITYEIIKELGNPIMSVSLPMDTDIEYYTDPEFILDKYEKQVDLIINSGIGSVSYSTVIDCTSGIPELVRNGAGDWESLF
jgi:tRNA threonylcarbamoyl adenosine modification protein (Sua5/YciO/YrdC/YwlC family)